METIMLNASLTTSFIKRALLILSIGLLTTLTSHAQDSTAGNEQAFVNFLRLENGNLFFTVKYHNGKGPKFNISVYDASGESLYRGYFSGEDYSKVFRAPAELGKLTVVIRNSSDKTQHKFEITSESRLVRETYVTAVAKY